MSDGFDDDFSKKEEKSLSHSNIKQIPKNKTAIALIGSEGGQKVPRIAAAGRGEVAARILELAYKNGVKVREDSDLAELLVKIELDSPIPSEAFMAVGEILSYLYRANGKKDPFNADLKNDT